MLDAVRAASVAMRLIFGSTLTTIGFPRQQGQPADETRAFTTQYSDNPYLMSKIAMEQALEAARNGLPAVVVNPTACFGPYDSKPTSGTQIVMIAKRLMPGYIQGDINAIDVRDVAAGMIKAAERGRVGERYIPWKLEHDATGTQYVWIARVAGVMAPIAPVPYRVARYGSKFGDWVFRTIEKAGSCSRLFRRDAQAPPWQQYDCSKAIRELDYPRSPVEPAIRDALTWSANTKYLPPRRVRNRAD